MSEPPYYVDLVTVPTGNGAETIEVKPQACRNGHPLAGRGSQTFWGLPAEDVPSCRGWRCVVCGDVTWGR